MSAETDAIDSRRASWVAALNSGSLDDYLAVVAEDVLWLPPGDLVLHGRAELRDWLEPFFEAFDYRFEVVRPAVSRSADWAVERAAYRSELSQGEETAVHRGSYLLFWKRLGGAWLIERYLDSSRLPLDPA